MIEKIEGIFKNLKNNMLAFWVGLLDGKGSLQVNQDKKKNLQYRITIKLISLLENERMLKLLTLYVGGRVIITTTKNREEVIWVEDEKERIIELIKIFESCPLRTNKLRCQLQFLKDCLRHNNLEEYLLTRDFKYSKNIPLEDKNMDCFNNWLSGFIETEGSFTIRKNKILSFSIGLKEDLFLISKIKEYFGALNKIQVKKDNLYLLEVYNKRTLSKIIEHCNTFPLLGAKKSSFDNFKFFY